MAKKKALSIALTQEEILVIMAYLGQTELAGFDPTVFADLSDSETKMIMEVAERGLLARGLLMPNPDNNHLKLSDVAHALVGACVSPDQSLVINFNYPDKPTTVRFFHTSRKMNMFHEIPIAGIHHFVALDSKDAIAKSAVSLLELKEPTVQENYSGVVLEDAIVEARDSEGDEAVEKLVSGGLSTVIAREFAHSFSNPNFNHTVVHLQHFEEDSVENGFSLLADDKYLWLLQPIDGNQKVEIRSVSVKTIASKIKQYIQ